MGKIGQGWQLTKLSFGVIRKDKRLLLFPIISSASIILILVSFMLPVFLIGTSNPDLVWIPLLIFGFAFYFVLFFVATFFKVALMGCAMKRLEGEVATIGYGIGFASGRIKYIAKWSLLAATVGLIFRALEDKFGFVGRIVMGLIGIAWATATYFVVPVLAFEKLAPFDAMRRSARLIKDSIGETVVSNLSMAIVFIWLAAIGIPALFIAAIIGGADGVVIGVLILLVYWVFLGVLASTAQGVLVAALYRYATTGKMAAEVPAQILEGPWRGVFDKKVESR